MEDLKEKVKNIRRDYVSKPLDESDLTKDPFDFFKKWLAEAIKAEIDEPNAFTLSTFGEQYPDSRIVLLRDFNKEGLSFYTNYDSKKAKDLISHPFASINFFWVELFRQIRIKATVEKVSDKMSDDYFASRPRESQLGAWASLQSEVLSSRAALETQLNQLEEKFKNKEVPRPENWGGYLLKPNYFEFWQGRPSRLHDRIVYEKNGEDWHIKRLYP
tara:strand:+ start:13304 stop:13951 length:648 start_codon:yes stop_codon:yes gene_type:complete